MNSNMFNANKMWSLFRFTTVPTYIIF
jgi:hypothetical protein